MNSNRNVLCLLALVCITHEAHPSIHHILARMAAVRERKLLDFDTFLCERLDGVRGLARPRNTNDALFLELLHDADTKVRA